MSNKDKRIDELESHRKENTAKIIQSSGIIDLVTVFDAILTTRQTRDKLQCLYENPMSNNFRITAVIEKISTVN